MKLLFLTDTHIRGNTPRGRTDNFPETVANKLKEVAGLAEEHGVDAIIHGGDLFDSPGPSLAVSRQFLSIFSKMPAPVYIIAGNHDLFGQNPATIHRTMLGLAVELGCFHLLDPGVPCYLRSGNIVIQLTGQHFHYDIDKRNPELDYAVSSLSCDAAVHVVHGMLLERPFHPDVAHTLIESIADKTEADFTLSGHAHLGFRDIKWGEKYFINPGALVRTSALKEEMKRIPSIVIIDFSKTPPQYKKIPLESALPGSQVLNRDHIEQLEFQKEKFSLFVQGIQSSGDYQITGLEEIINIIASRDGLQKEIKEEALRKLALVQEEFTE
ncbi:MAG: metallophosphoesterase [Clostridiales bacterium]|nr:metallophosphoesterase [Clostridiales bacterium]MCF8021317.1 metallophosphoesterase [Clostridiales bacterium]